MSSDLIQIIVYGVIYLLIFVSFGVFTQHEKAKEEQKKISEKYKKKFKVNY